MAHLLEINPYAENPFRLFPQLRTIWPAEFVVVAEEAIDEAWNAWHHDSTDYGKIFLICTVDRRRVIGLTGFMPWDAPDRVGLRWHGLLSTFRGNGLSLEIMEHMRILAKERYPKAKTLVEFMPELATLGEEGEYFERAGFKKSGPLGKYEWSTHLWQEYTWDIAVSLHPLPVLRLEDATIYDNQNTKVLSTKIGRWVWSLPNGVEIAYWNHANGRRLRKSHLSIQEPDGLVKQYTFDGKTNLQESWCDIQMVLSQHPIVAMPLVGSAQCSYA